MKSAMSLSQDVSVKVSRVSACLCHELAEQSPSQDVSVKESVS